MRASSLPTVVVCSLALALGLPVGGASAFAPGKSKKGDAAAKDPVRDSGADPVSEPAKVDGAPRQGRLFVDADALGEGGPVLAGRAMKVGLAGLESQAVTITDAPAGPELRVVLSLRDAGGYRVEYEIVYDGDVIKDGTGGFDCQLCTEDELVEKVEALAVQVAPKLVVPKPEPEPGPGPGPKIEPDPGPDPEGPKDPIEDVEPGGLGGKGKAGVALVVMGSLGVGTGVPLLIRKPTISEDDPTRLDTTRPVGGGVLGLGAVLVVVGAVLLASDRKQAKAKQASKGKATAVVHPWVGIDRGGIGLTGRF
ncbi:hypothetical protein [Paraliomyxa miuraensis]|uniref:hypothetical protein n=1 Tax=Paraliomyxa miuraensis TaxID=376150 RepID=UPI0022526030|nr:hypothetical protein [Paraliomyxa miuraensis]MCX4240017.1 hypothetical protein [Paraliomyxa miuraensis]